MTQKGQLAPLLGFCWPYISRKWSEKQVLFRPAKRFMVKSHGAIQAKLEGDMVTSRTKMLLCHFSR